MVKPLGQKILSFTITVRVVESPFIDALSILGISPQSVQNIKLNKINEINNIVLNVHVQQEKENILATHHRVY